MNTKLRSRKVLIPTAVVVLLAAGGGVAWAVAESDDTVTGSDATRIGNAARTAANLPDAKVLEVEKDDDDGVISYEVTLDSGAGGRTEVELNESLGLVRDLDDRDSDDTAAESAAEKAEDAAEAAGTESLDASERRVGDVVVDEEDGTISDADLQKVMAAATKAVPGGTVTQVSSNTPDADDTGLDAREAFSVDLTTGTGTALVEHEVDLDAQFAVLRTSVD